MQCMCKVFDYDLLVDMRIHSEARLHELILIICLFYFSDSYSTSLVRNLYLRWFGQNSVIFVIVLKAPFRHAPCSVNVTAIQHVGLASQYIEKLQSSSLSTQQQTK